MDSDFRDVIFTLNGRVYDYRHLYSISSDETRPICIMGKKRLVPLRPDSNALIILCNGCGGKLRIAVFRLWLLVFKGEPPKDANGRYYTADHINVDHTDHRPCNLRWSSCSDQVKNRRLVRRVTWVPISIDTLTIRPFGGNGLFFSYCGKVLKTISGIWHMRCNGTTSRSGYVSVTINDRLIRLSRIIAHLFPIDTDEALLCVDDLSLIADHQDGDRSNNHRYNLLICTQKRNSELTYERGRGNSRKRKVVCDFEGDQLIFDSAVDVAKHLGVTLSMAKHALYDNVPLASGHKLPRVEATE